MVRSHASLTPHQFESAPIGHATRRAGQGCVRNSRAAAAKTDVRLAGAGTKAATDANVDSIVVPSGAIAVGSGSGIGVVIGTARSFSTSAPGAGGRQAARRATAA